MIIWFRYFNRDKWLLFGIQIFNCSVALDRRISAPRNCIQLNKGLGFKALHGRKSYVCIVPNTLCEETADFSYLFSLTYPLIQASRSHVKEEQGLLVR